MNALTSTWSTAPQIINPYVAISQDLVGKNIFEKERYLREVFSVVHISKEHEWFWYWTVTSSTWSAIFSINENKFLKIPHTTDSSEYFWSVTSKWAIPFSDGTIIITFALWWHRVSPDDVLNIDAFCYIDNWELKVFRGTTPWCSLQMAISLFIQSRTVINTLENPTDKWNSTPILQ